MLGFSLVKRDPFQPLMNRAVRVMLLLIPDIGADPLDVLGAETDNSVSGLPFKTFLPQLGVGFVRRCALELADQLADPRS